MIQRLRTRNFQSHKDTDLILHPGVNVIVGQSQNGKSALLRSLMWLKDNRPLGFRFHSWFAKKESTEVEVRVDNISIIKRKTKSKTTYRIADRDLDYKEGRGVPDEVGKLLNLSELNIQSQLDPFFLITSSPQEIARTFNRMTKVEQADEWNKKLTTRINKTSNEVEFLRKDIEEKELEVNNLPDLRNIKNSYRKMRMMVKELDKMEEEVKSLESLLVDIEATERQLDIYDRDMPVLDYEKERMRIEMFEEDKETERELEDVVENINDLEKSIEKYGEMPTLDYNLEKRKLDEFMEVLDTLERISKLMQELSEAGRRLKKAKDDEEWSRDNFEDYLREIGKCPTCQNDLTDEKIKEMVDGK